MLVLPAFANPHELTEIGERLAQAPDDVSLLFSRVCIVDLLGRNDEAKGAYIEVIKRDCAHIGALGNLGTLLYNAGYRSAARLTYGEALKHHPRDLRTLINLGNALLENNDLADARGSTSARLRSTRSIEDWPSTTSHAQCDIHRETKDIAESHKADGTDDGRGHDLGTTVT